MKDYSFLINKEDSKSTGSITGSGSTGTGRNGTMGMKDYSFLTNKESQNDESKYYAALNDYYDLGNKINNYYSGDNYTPAVDIYYKNEAKKASTQLDSYMNELSALGYGAGNELYDAMSTYKSGFSDVSKTETDVKSYQDYTDFASGKYTNPYDYMFKDVKDKNGVQAEKDKYQQLYDSATTWEEKYAYEDTLKYLDDKYYSYMSPAEIQLLVDEKNKELDAAKADAYTKGTDYTNYELAYNPDSKSKVYGDGTIAGSVLVNEDQAKRNYLYQQKSDADNKVKQLTSDRDALSNRLADANANKISQRENGTELGLGMEGFKDAYRKAISGENKTERDADGLDLSADLSASELEKSMRKRLMDSGYTESEAWDWVESTVRSINKEVNSERIQGYYDNALGSGFWKGAGLTVARTGANLAGGFVAAGEAASQMFGKSNYKDYDIYDSNFLLSNYVNQTSQGIMDTHKYQFDENGNVILDENGNPKLVENNKWEWDLPFMGKTDMFDTLYGILTSSADSMLAAAVGGGLGSAAVGGVTIGLQAGTQELLRLAEQGASRGTALVGGIIAGGFESLFETISIGQFNALNEAGVAFTKNMTKEEAKAACKEVAKNMAKSFITNASEEFNTELANVLYDAYTNGAFSDYESLIREYHMQNPDDTSEESEQKAKEYAIHELTKRIVEAGVTGGLQGLLMGGVGTVNGSVRESYLQNKFFAGMYNYGDQIRSEAEGMAAEKGWSQRDIDNYVNETVAKGDFSKYNVAEGRTAQTIKDTLEVNPDAKLANRYDGKVSDGKALNATQLSKLFKENNKVNTEADKTKITNAVSERLSALGETGDLQYLSEIITKQAMGKRLDTDEKYTLENSKYGQRVLNEAMPGNVINGDYSSEWAGNIGTKVVNPGAYNKTRIMNQVRSIMGEDEKSSKQTVEVKKADITRTGVPSIDAVVRQMVVDGKDSVSEGLVKSVINNSEAVEYLGVNLDGKTSSEQRATVRTALEELAKKNAPKANDHSNTAAAVTEMANEYKGMSNAVISLYNLNPTADVETFAAELKRAYELGRGEGNLKELNNIKTLTETQKRLAYAFGKAQNIKSQNIAEHEASKAFKETIEKGGTANKLNRKGKLTSTIPSKTINKLFQHGSNQKSAVQMLRTLAQITGFNIEIYDSKLVGAQGEFDPVTNTIRIDINAGIYSNMDVADLANYTMLRTFCHEFTHAGEKWAAEEYQILRAAIIEAYAQNENFDFDKEVDKQIAANEDSWLLSKKEQYINEGNSEEAATQMAEEWVENNKWDLGSREVVAESLVDILPESKFIENLYKKSPSVCQRITDALHRFIEKIQNYWSSLVKNDAPEANALKYEMEGTVRYLSDIVEKFDAMAEKAVENKRLAAEKYEQKMAMLNPETVNARNISKEGWDSVKSSDGTNMFQLRTMRQDVDGYMQDLKDAGLVGEGKLMSEAELNELYKTINDTMDYVEKNIDAIERSETFRDMDGENRPFLPYKDNSDPHYKKALDFSTLCRKRLLTQAITEKLQKALGRAVSPVEQVKIRKEIQLLRAEGKKLDVACALCYVEAARLKSPKVINEFLNNKTDSLKNYFSLKNSTFKHEVYEKKLGDWKEAKGLDRKATKDQIKAAGYNVNEFNKFGLEVRKGYWQWLEKANPEQFAKEQNIIDIANSMDNSEFLSAENLAKLRGDEQLSILYDAFISKVRMATRSKAQETDVPYKRGDINQVGDAIIDQMNEESGFRHQSWSDFQAMHILDTMAAVIELATKNAKVHTYTKVTDMVRFLGDTGMMINMSLIPAGDTGISADGMIEFDPAEGMDFDEMLKLRDQYADTAGNIAIGISDEHILKLLNDPRIDYVIPYHVSGLNADMRKRMGIRKWKDYSHYQNEKGDGWDKKAPRLAEWFSESEAANYANAYDYMVEASKKYLQLCYERNLTPKFSQFLEKNSDGSYSLREDAQNYWKLLIDRKMVNHITQSIIIQKAVKPSFNADTTLDILSNEVNSQAAIDAREAEKYIVNKMLTEPGTFTKKELEQARIVRDAAIRMAIEDISVEEMGVKQNQYRGVSEAERITAEKLEAEGKSKSEIWKATGLFRSYDNFWRAEIKDNKAKVKLSDEYIKELQAKQRDAKNKISVADSYVNEVSRELEEVNRIIAKKESNGEDVEYWKKQVEKLEPRLEKAKAKAEATRKEYSADIKLSDILEHDELFKYYPELKDVNIYFEEDDNYGGKALYGSIILNPSNIQSTFGARNTLFHEIQHEIQMLEGFAQGSNKSMFTDDEYSEEIGELIDRRTEVANKLGNVLKRNGYSIKMDEWDRFGSYFKSQYNRESDGLISKYYFELERLADNNKKTRALLDEYYEINSELFATTSYGKYLNTAGEIEARDAAFRSELSDEDLEKYEPDTKNKYAHVWGTSANQDSTYGLIKKLKDGRKYVKADRLVVTGVDPKSWGEQIELYINKNIRNGNDVSLIADDGSILLITRNTAGKASFRNYVIENGVRRLSSEDEYLAKLNAEAHIDELAQISKLDNNKKTPDENGVHSDFASNGWNYRTAFFLDADGTYYKVQISIANNADGAVIYNVGKMQKRSNPEFSGSSANGSARRIASLNMESIMQTDSNVKQNQQRKQKLTDRYVLSQASQQIDRSQLTEEQAKALDTFDKYLAESMQLRAQRDEQNELIRKYRKENNNDELVKAENRRNILSGKISRVDSKMLTFENTAVAKQILKKSREIIETAQDLETSERLEKYYSRQLERAAQNSEYDAERNKALKKKLAEVRADRDAQIAALKKAKNEKISNIIANKNQRIDEAIKEKRNILNEYKAEQRENMTARDIRNHIYSMAEEFRTMVTKPGKSITRHAPVSLTSAIANFCDIFDENRYMRLQKNENTLAQRKKDYENGKSWDKDVDAEAVKIKNREVQLARQNAALDMLKLKYDALMKDELYNSYYDEHIAGMLTQAKESLTQKDLFEMTSKELTGIDNLMRALRKTVVDANKAVAMKKGQEISDIASRLAAQIDQAVPKKNNFGRTMQKYAMWQMRPDTFFSYITGYAKDSVGEDVQQMFVDGTERMLTMQREYYHMMSKLTESKKQSVRDEMKKLMNDHKKLADWGLTDRNGNSVSTTRGMMLQAYMLLLQEDSFNSLVYGGFKIPRMDAYYKGNMSEAYSGADEDTLVSAGVYGDVYVLQDELNGIKDRQTQIEEKLAEQGITDEEKAKLKAENETISKRADELNRQIADIVSGAEARLYDMKFKIENMLTETEKEVLKVAREWYDYSGEKLDEVFLDLYGYVPIRPKNYTTIHRSLDTVQTDIRSVDMATNLENFGSAKERVKSKDPILLTDIFNELNGNVQRMSKYYGYVEAQKDFNRIWNYKTPGTQSSIKSKIAAKFLDGDNAVMPSGSQYIENYVKNISGANAEREGSSPFHALYSGLAGANLALNPRVALSQWASIPTAAAEVGWANMAKGFAKGFTGMFSTEYKRKLSENSVWYWQRYRGEGGITEVSDMMNSAAGPWGKFTKTKAGKAFLNWCQLMDTMATASMWTMAEEQAKQNGFKRGTEEFKAETEKVFRDIIRKTQPNYTTTERSDLLRDKRDSMKLLTMYKTQSNQNLNILMEATGKFRKMKQDLKNNANGVTKADVKAATKNLANAYTAVILGGSLAFAALRSIVNIAFGKIRDDDDEFTAEALAESILKDTVSSMTGMFSIGSQVYDFILPIVSGDNYYGLSDSAFGAVSDILEQTVKIIQKAQDEDKEIDLKDINKEAVAICSALGIPLRNAENIGKAIIMYVKDAKNGTFGTFEAGANRTKADELQRFLNGYLEENEEKIGRAEAGYLVLSGNDEKAFKSGLASKAKDWVKKGKLTTEQYEDILKNYLGYEDKDVEDKMHRINAELKLGSIKSDDWTDVFKTNASAEDIDYVVAEFGGNFKDSYKAYRNIGYEPEKAYEAAKALDGDNSGGVSKYEAYIAAQKLPKDKAEKFWAAMGNKEKFSEYSPDKTDSYKYDVKTSSTISSYNDKNWTNALTDKSISNDDLDTLILAYGGTKFQDPYKELRAKNYSPVAAYNILTAMDTDNSGGISQPEALAYIRSQKLSQADAEALWNMFGWTKSYQYYSSRH